MFNRIPNSSNDRKHKNNNDYEDEEDEILEGNNNNNSSNNDEDDDDLDQQENTISAFSGVDYLLDKYKPLIKDVLFLSNISSSMGTKDRILVSS